MASNFSSFGSAVLRADRPAVARRQFQASLVAVAVMATVGLTAAVSVRNSMRASEEASMAATKAPAIIKVRSHSVPAGGMQAVDQTRPDRRS